MTRSDGSPVWPGVRGRWVALPEVGEILKDYRRAERLTQRDLAAKLQIDQSYLSRIESGRRAVRDVGFLLQVARLLGLPPAQLGLSNELVHSMRRHRQASDHDATGAKSDASSDHVEAQQAEWRSVRRHLNNRRHDLARLATALYSPDVRVARSTLLAPAEWVPAEPVRLEDIELCWEPDSQPLGAITGTEPEASHVLPLRSAGHQYGRYTSAIRYLDAPSLFENRPSYRLLDLQWAGLTGRMRFGLGTYFDKLDLAEAVGHELAGVHQREPDRQPTLRDLSFRALVGDPFDPSRRALLPAVTTLTLRRRRTHGTASFLLHWRDPSQVATAAGIYDVIPAGEFQPSSVAHWDQANDFDVWRNVVREYSEELLGTPEHDGSRSTPIDYDAWPLYRQLQAARQEGRLSAYCLGVAVDALTLAVTILTVVVLDDDVFDAAFHDTVDINAEGIVVSGEDGARGTGIPFTEQNVRRFVDREPIASPGAGCLELAWRHRIALLST